MSFPFQTKKALSDLRLHIPIYDTQCELHWDSPNSRTSLLYSTYLCGVLTLPQKKHNLNKYPFACMWLNINGIKFSFTLQATH